MTPDYGDSLFDVATEIADEAIGVFSEMYPHIRMNIEEWRLLREAIEREVRGKFGPNHEISAHDLKAGAA